MPIGIPSAWLGGAGDALSTLGQSLAQRQAQQQALALQQQAAAQKASEFQQTLQLERDKMDQQGAIAGLTKAIAEQQRQQTLDEAFAKNAPKSYEGQDPTALDIPSINRIKDSSYASQLQPQQSQLPVFTNPFGGAPALTPQQTFAYTLKPNDEQAQAFATKQAAQETANELKNQRVQAQTIKDAQAKAQAEAYAAYQAYVASNPKGTPEQRLGAYQTGLAGRTPEKPYSEVLPGLAEEIAIDKAKASKPPAPGADVNWTLGGESPVTADFKKTLDPNQQQFLNQFKPQEQQIIAELAQYKYPAPTGMGGFAAFVNNPTYKVYWNAAQRLNPDLTPQDYAAKNNFVTKWTDPNGQSGQQAQSASRLLEHMVVQMNNIAQLHNATGRPLSAARNLGQTYLEGGAAPGNYNETNQILSEEANKLWVGGAGSNESRQAISNIANPNASPEQQYQSLLTLYKLMQGQISAIEGSYTRVMNRPAPSILTPSAQAASQNLLLNLTALARNPELAYGSK